MFSPRPRGPWDAPPPRTPRYRSSCDGRASARDAPLPRTPEVLCSSGGRASKPRSFRDDNYSQGTLAAPVELVNGVARSLKKITTIYVETNSTSLVISMLPFTDLATGHESA